MINLQWQTFNELSNKDLYEMLKARQQVFSVEQNCIYLDMDDLDFNSWHLLAWISDDNQMPYLGGYLRIVPPGGKYGHPSIGRVLTSSKARGIGLGKTLLKSALEQSKKIYPNDPITISAQAHLENFYTAFGFSTCSAPYDEDGIPHIEMQT